MLWTFPSVHGQEREGTGPVSLVPKGMASICQPGLSIWHVACVQGPTESVRGGQGREGPHAWVLSPPTYSIQSP